MLENWYEQCVRAGILEHSAGIEKDTFLFFKGFKICRSVINDTVSYQMYDVRRKDFYTFVKDDEMEIFREHGFLKGATHLEYYRNRKRVDFFSNEIDKEFRKRRGHERRYKENPKRAQKAIDVCNNRIGELGVELKKYTEKCRVYEYGANYDLK